MELKYNILRNLDRLASLLRKLGLQQFTRVARNLIAKLFLKEIRVEVGCHRLYGTMRDRSFLYKLKEGSFEPETVRLFLEVIKPGMVVLDLGAYIGYYTLLAARQVGPKGKVYAFEPDPSSYSLLERNVRHNGHSNIVTIRKAVAREGRIKKLHQHASDPTMNSLLARKGWETTVVVECISVDEFLGEEQVDLVKLDVEGAELETLQGMAKTLERCPTLTLIVELNSVSLSEGNNSPEELLNQIRKLGFHNIIYLDQHRNNRGELDLCNLYCGQGSRT